jgi:hypothetical protein
MVERSPSEERCGLVRLGVGWRAGPHRHFRGAGGRGRFGRRSGFRLGDFGSGGPGGLCGLPLLGELVGERLARGDEFAERAVRPLGEFGVDLRGAGRDRDRPGLAGFELGPAPSAFRGMTVRVTVSSGPATRSSPSE